MIKKIYLYLKYKKEINAYYSYALKNGFCSDETLNWEDRLDYYIDGMRYEMSR